MAEGQGRGCEPGSVREGHMLNDKSLIGASSDLHLQQAKDLLKEMNPNDLTKSGGWFDNLPRENYRFVPYNGGLSDTQLKWFKQELEASEKEGERVY